MRGNERYAGIPLASAERVVDFGIFKVGQREAQDGTDASEFPQLLT